MHLGIPVLEDKSIKRCVLWSQEKDGTFMWNSFTFFLQKRGATDPGPTYYWLMFENLLYNMVSWVQGVLYVLGMKQTMTLKENEAKQNRNLKPVIQYFPPHPLPFSHFQFCIIETSNYFNFSCLKKNSNISFLAQRAMFKTLHIRSDFAVMILQQ